MNKIIEFVRKAIFYVRVLSGYKIRSFRLQLENQIKEVLSLLIFQSSILSKPFTITSWLFSFSHLSNLHCKESLLLSGSWINQIYLCSLYSNPNHKADNIFKLWFCITFIRFRGWGYSWNEHVLINNLVACRLKKEGSHEKASWAGDPLWGSSNGWRDSSE